MDNVKKLPLRDFTRYCMSIAQVPSSYLSGLTLEEQLLWLCSFLTDEVIPTINNNGKAVEELQALYVELKNYVDNYFDNLDIQEEVNTKLEEMAQSGELADIIAQYIQLQGVLAYDSVADMAAAENVANGSITRTLGFYDYNDGGGSYYKIRTIRNDDVIDNITIIPITNSEDLIAELLNSDDIINVKCYGAKADGIHDDTNNIKTCITKNPEKTIYFPDGTYLVNDKIEIYNSAIVDIKCDYNANFISTETIDCFFDYGLGERPADYKVFRRHVIDGGNYDCTNASYGIIVNSRSHLNYVKNINMTHVKNVGLYLKKHNDYISGDCLIENISITGETSTGVNDNIGIEVESYDNELNNIRIQATTIGIKISGAGNKIYNAHPLFIGAVNTKEDYERSIGFLITSNDGGWNEFTCCYADSFCTGYKIAGNSINNITNGKNNTYITPMQDLQSQFIWITNGDAIINLIGCKYYPSNPPAGVTYQPKIIRCDFGLGVWYARNRFKAIDCDWGIISLLPDNDPGLGLKSNHITSQQYTWDYNTVMEENRYYKIAVINTSQALQRIHYNAASDGEWNIDIRWTGGDTVGSATFVNIDKLYNPSHNKTISICDPFTVDGIPYAYLCIKALDSNSGLNACFSDYASGGNCELFTTWEKFGTEPFNPTTIIAEANLY